MPKAARIATAIPASTASSEQSDRGSDGSSLVAVALFSGIGLLVSLVAILMGVPLT